MSDEDKKKKASLGGSFADALRSGGEVTTQQIIDGLVKIDDNLPMKTDVKDPFCMTLIDVYGFYARLRGCNNLADFYEFVAKWLRINWVSHNRESRREILEGFAYAYLEDFRKKEDKLDEMFGGRKK